MSVENSRSKRSIPDITKDPAPAYDAQEHGDIVASTSTLVASPCTKRGTVLPLFLVPVVLHRLPSCAIHSEACRDA
jgi:hypothetical protein